MTRPGRDGNLVSVRAVAPLLVFLWSWTVHAHDPDARLLQLDAALASQPNDVARRIERARLLRAGGEAARAYVDADHAARAARDPAEARGERGLCLGELGHHARAVADLEVAIAARPRDRGLREARARSLMALGRSEEALADVEVALAARPDPDLFLVRASILRASRGLAAAVTSLEEAVAKTGAIVLEEELRLREAELDPVAALARADAAVARRPDDPGPRLWRGRLNGARGDAAAAASDFQAALALADRRCALRDTALCRLDRARSLEALGRLAEARAVVRAVVADVPGWPEAHELANRIDHAERR